MSEAFHSAHSVNQKVSSNVKYGFCPSPGFVTQLKICRKCDIISRCTCGIYDQSPLFSVSSLNLWQYPPLPGELRSSSSSLSSSLSFCGFNERSFNDPARDFFRKSLPECDKKTRVKRPFATVSFFISDEVLHVWVLCDLFNQFAVRQVQPALDIERTKDN